MKHYSTKNGRNMTGNNMKTKLEITMGKDFDTFFFTDKENALRAAEDEIYHNHLLDNKF